MRRENTVNCSKGIGVTWSWLVSKLAVDGDACDFVTSLAASRCRDVLLAPFGAFGNADG